MILKQMLVSVVSLVSAAVAGQVEWMHDLEAAGKKAAAEGKLVLVEFTGSDWCGACKLQHKNVLEKEEFADWVQKHCVPAVVDVPMDVSRVGGMAQKRYNEMLCDSYGLKSFPSLKMMTPELIVVGGYSGAQRNPQAAIATLEKSFAEAKRVQQVLALEGDARIQSLLALYGEYPEQDKASRFNLLTLLVAADPDDTAGKHAELRRWQQMRQVHAQLSQALTPEARLDGAAKALAEAVPGNEAELRILKGNALREVAFKLMRYPKSVQEVEKARDMMLESAECQPNEKDRAEFRKFVEQQFADPAALYELRRKKVSISPR